MTRSKVSTKSDAAGLLERLRPEEAVALLHQLLHKHPELHSEAEQFATMLVSSSSIEDIAEDVHYRVTSIDLDDLNGRAGAHSWGYVGPDQAAQDLLEEAIEELVEDLKRQAELGLVSAAEVLCAGIVQGLYQARDTKSDGALGWAPDFPGEEADYVVAEFVRACPPTSRKAAQKSLMETLAQRVPKWAEGLRRAADRSIKE
jgi:hypothetical protein